MKDYDCAIIPGTVQLTHNELIKSSECNGNTELKRSYTADGDDPGVSNDFGIYVCKRCGSTITTLLNCHQYPWAREKAMGKTVRELMDEKGITIKDLAEFARCSLRQAEYYSSGQKEMSQLELIGLENMEKKRGDTPVEWEGCREEKAEEFRSRCRTGSIGLEGAWSEWQSISQLKDYRVKRPYDDFQFRRVKKSFMELLEDVAKRMPPLDCGEIGEVLHTVADTLNAECEFGAFTEKIVSCAITRGAWRELDIVIEGSDIDKGIIDFPVLVSGRNGNQCRATNINQLKDMIITTLEVSHGPE